jgi:hypothetical protein
VHFPTEQPLRVGVERVQIAPIAAHGLIADSRLALDRRRGNGMEQFDATIACDRVGRNGAVTEVGDKKWRSSGLMAAQQTSLRVSPTDPLTTDQAPDSPPRTSPGRRTPRRSSPVASTR